jgi:DNA-binding CsgD family transcriptional regulator
VYICHIPFLQKLICLKWKNRIVEKPDITEHIVTYDVSQWLGYIGSKNSPDGIERLTPQLSERVKIAEQAMLQNQFGLAVVNMVTLQYLFLSANMGRLIGIDTSELEKGGLATFSTLLPASEMSYWDTIMQHYWKFYSRQANDRRLKMRVSAEFLMINTKGEERWMMQQTLVVQETERGVPHITFNFVAELDYLKTPRSKTKVPGHLRHLTIHMNQEEPLIFRVLPEKGKLVRRHVLSTREVELLTYLGQGLSTKEIADKLGTSPATVNTQRKKMLVKTGTRNGTALVSYCKLLGWM